LYNTAGKSMPGTPELMGRHPIETNQFLQRYWTGIGVDNLQPPEPEEAHNPQSPNPRDLLP